MVSMKHLQAVIRTVFPTKQAFQIRGIKEKVILKKNLYCKILNLELKDPLQNNTAFKMKPAAICRPNINRVKILLN